MQCTSWILLWNKPCHQFATEVEIFLLILTVCPLVSIVLAHSFHVEYLFQLWLTSVTNLASSWRTTVGSPLKVLNSSQFLTGMSWLHHCPFGAWWEIPELFPATRKPLEIFGIPRSKETLAHSPSSRPRLSEKAAGHGYTRDALGAVWKSWGGLAQIQFRPSGPLQRLGGTCCGPDVAMNGEQTSRSLAWGRDFLGIGHHNSEPPITKYDQLFFTGVCRTHSNSCMGLPKITPHIMWNATWEYTACIYVTWTWIWICIYICMCCICYTLAHR